ncbi:hypothetical protein RTBOTA2_002609 [Rhodotorula toruloides]|nr:hypothetical protein RTBOTA2_002609 [Rhodotorula toruloides]
MNVQCVDKGRQSSKAASGRKAAKGKKRTLSSSRRNADVCFAEKTQRNLRECHKCDMRIAESVQRAVERTKTGKRV